MHTGLHVDVYYTIILLEKTCGNFLDVISVCLLGFIILLCRFGWQIHLYSIYYYYIYVTKATCGRKMGCTL